MDTLLVLDPLFMACMFPSPSHLTPVLGLVLVPNLYPLSLPPLPCGIREVAQVLQLDRELLGARDLAGRERLAELREEGGGAFCRVRRRDV